MTNSKAQIGADEPEPSMFTNQRTLRIMATTMCALLVVILYFEFQRKLDYVAGCHTRFAQLELISAQATRNETALDAREKALEAAEAQLNAKQ